MREQMKILSVHTPKAGGTSVSRALSDAFGDEYFTDYSEDPADPRSPRNLDPEAFFSRNRQLPQGAACLHGHYHPGQFNLESTFLFTLLRHPVDNIVSIYFFWKTLPPQGQPLHDYFLSQGLDIIALAKLPLLRYLYSQTYFGGFDMSRFDLIGRHDERELALHELARVTGRKIDASVYVNATQESVERAELIENSSITRALEHILEDDIRFYDRFCG